MTTLPQHHQFPRRSLLAGASLAAALASQQLPALADDERQVFTFVTDSHADPENQAHLDRFEATMRAIETDDPALVLHGGDITEYGVPGNYEEHFRRVPTSLRDRIVHVPGNHETRWDATAYETYDSMVDERNVAMTVAGIQVLVMDPTMPQQELAHYSREDLAWLHRELRRKPAHRPTIVVAHFPQGEGHYYTVNQDEFLDVIEGRGVQAMFVGHVHQLGVDNFNGVTHVQGGAARTKVQYLRCTVTGGRDRELLLEQVEIPDPTRWQERTVTELGTVALTVARGTDRLKPRGIELRTSADALTVEVQQPHTVSGMRVEAAIYDQDNYGGSTEDEWYELTSRGNRWTGTIDVSGLAPGEHRARVNVLHEGRRWRSIVGFTIPDDHHVPTAEQKVDGLIHGALAQLGSRVFVPTSTGGLHAFDVEAGRLRKAWSSQTGPLWTCLATDEDLGLVVAASADHRIRAFAAADGAVRWERDLCHPVMSDPLVARVDDTSHVVVMAGETLALLSTQDGSVRWSRSMPGVSAGRAAIDDRHVYVGLGDGRAHAVSVHDGADVWTVEMTDRDETYRRWIYGPWNNHVTLITEQLVLVSTVSHARALDRNTGEVVWELPHSYLYTPVRQLDEGDLVMVDEWGDVRRVDATTGAAQWFTEALVPRALEAAPVVHNGAVYLVGVTGMLGVADLDTGEIRSRRQLMANNVIASPVIVEDTLVVGHMPGVVRAYATD